MMLEHLETQYSSVGLCRYIPYIMGQSHSVLLTSLAGTAENLYHTMDWKMGYFLSMTSKSLLGNYWIRGFGIFEVL